MNKPVVYVAMCADVLHHGHINLLKSAAELGEVVVGLLTDQAIASYKRVPLLTFEERRAVVASLSLVSRIVSQDTHDYRPNLLKLQPAFVVHGDDWQTGNQAAVRGQVIDTIAAWGGRLIEPQYTDGVSSSALQLNITKGRISSERRISLLRRLLAAKDFILALEAHNGISAHAVDAASRVNPQGANTVFDAIWLGSLTSSAAVGMPDNEIVDLSTRLAIVGQVAAVSNKPIIFDGDSGGRLEFVAATVRHLERSGVSALVLEDKTGRKQNSLYGASSDQKLADVDEFCEKIQSACQASLSSDFMVVARAEGLALGKTEEETLKRIERYLNAGAHAVLVHAATPDFEPVRNVLTALRKDHPSIPLFLVPTAYLQTPQAELVSAGANVIIYANQLLRAAYPAMLECARSILDDPSLRSSGLEMLPVSELLAISEDFGK